MEIELDLDRLDVIIIALLVILVGLLFMIFLGGEDEPVPTESREGLVKYSNNFVEVNITEVSDSRARFDSSYFVQYEGDPAWKEFAVEGSYFGEVFLGSLTRGERTVMRGQYTLDPTDGTPDAFIVPVFDDRQERFKGEVYVDKDFREKVDMLSIAWGTDLQYVREYKFDTEIFPGIYRDVVYDEDYNAYLSKVGMSAGVGVGNFTEPQLRQGDAKKFMAVFLN
jgi:hypothetical protein